MPRKQIDVRKHTRHLPSGKITTVKAHTRNINSNKKYRKIPRVKDQINDDLKDIQEESNELRENINNIEDNIEDIRILLNQRQNEKFSKKWNTVIEKPEDELSSKDQAKLNNLIRKQNIVHLERDLNEKELDKFATKLNEITEKNKVITSKDAEELNNFVARM